MVALQLLEVGSFNLPSMNQIFFIKVSPSASNESKYSKKKYEIWVHFFNKCPFFVINKSIKKIFIMNILMYIYIHSMACKLKNICRKFQVDKFIIF